MSEAGGAGSDQLDNWVFDSLVNFLHGSIWKVPVVGFIEEKSVVFDPDSYNNMTEEKEEEFRKIHEGYKTVVDFMLTSFMEDLQVTPEQVEEACRVREHQSKTLPESHITKVALEQLWAAEDFTAFRRLMTRKNIDLQLQSLELLVAKYGVLSPALRSGDSEDPVGEDGEDDFLQVVIRYSDQLETFKCDYGAEAASSGFAHRNYHEEASTSPSVNGSSNSKHNNYLPGCKSEEDEKNMKLHLAGIGFKNNIAPTPIHYQATLTSSPSTSSPNIAENHTFSNNSQAQTETQISLNPNSDNNDIIFPEPVTKGEEQNSDSVDGAVTLTATIIEPESPPQHDLSVTDPTQDHASPTPPPSPSPPNENFDSSIIEEGPETQVEPDSDAVENNEKENAISENESSLTAEPPTPTLTKEPVKVTEEPESQLIQLEEAEAAIEEETNISLENVVKAEVSAPPRKSQGEPLPKLAPLAVSPHYDEKMTAEIASTAPEQRRLLTAVRKALEVNPEDSEPIAPINIPRSSENDEDLQKRREYLRAQRDKLIAMKKQEREKLLLENSGAGAGSQSARPKSARAAQIAIKNPNNMRAASLTSEKSLSARRALADRLKQELIEK